MSARIRLVLIAAALAVTAAALPATAHAAKPGGNGCTARNSVTVERTAAVRVYRVSDSEDNHEMFACRYRTGRTVDLASWFDCECSRSDEPAPQITLNGLAVAANRYSCPPLPETPCTGRFSVFNLITGRAVRRTPTGGAVNAVLTRGGAAAFATTGGEIVALDGGGRRVLDPGPGVGFTSLALAGNRVYWLRGGAPQTALLR